MNAIHTDGLIEFSKVLDNLDKDGVYMIITTPYNPESNGLAKRTYAVLPNLTRVCLKSSEFPQGLWHHAVGHVNDARNVTLHSRTKQVQYQSAFRHTRPYLKHIHAFGCRALYGTSAQMLPTFWSFVRDRLILRHDGGGIY